jgi:dihydrofolate reductase
MRKLVLAMAMSLDGFIGDTEGKGDWMFRTQGPVGRAFVTEKMSGAGLHLVGGSTFKQWAGWWPAQTGPIAELMNQTPKAVFARSGDPRKKTQEGGDANRWADAEWIDGDLVEGIERLKKGDGKLMLAQGGIAFAQSVAASGLVDEYWIVKHPIALGNGLPLFDKLAQPLPLTVIETQSFPTGASWTAYRPA